MTTSPNNSSAGGTTTGASGGTSTRTTSTQHGASSKRPSARRRPYEAPAVIETRKVTLADIEREFAITKAQAEDLEEHAALFYRDEADRDGESS